MKKVASVFAFLLLLPPSAQAQESESPTVIESTPVETTQEETPTQPAPVVEEPTPVEDTPVVEDTPPPAPLPTQVVPPVQEDPALVTEYQQPQTVVTEDTAVPSLTQQRERVSPPVSSSVPSSAEYLPTERPDSGSKDKPIRKQLILMGALFSTFLTVLLWVGIYKLYKVRKEIKRQELSDESEEGAGLSDVVNYDPDKDFDNHPGGFYSAENKYPDTDVLNTPARSWADDDTQEIPVVEAELPPRRSKHPRN